MASVDVWVNFPDIGWHIRSGAMISTSGTLPEKAWFTFTLSDYNWVAHEWLQELILAKIWISSGMLGVQWFYALLGMAFIFWLLHLFLPPKQPLFLVSAAALPITAVLIATRLLRPQIVSSFGFVTVLFLILEYKRSRALKYLYLIPLVFLVWANLHAGFPVGFIVLSLFLIAGLIEIGLAASGHKLSPSLESVPQLTKADLLQVLLVSLVSFIATLCNPYGIRLYQEVFHTLSDSYSSQSVLEWLPTSISSSSGEAFFASIVFLFLSYFFKAKKQDHFFLALNLVFFCLGLSATRHASFFVLLVIVQLLPLIPSASAVIQQNRSYIFSVITLFLVLTLVLKHYSGRVERSKLISREEQLYPAVALQNYQISPQSRVFHAFHWGSYLALKSRDFQTFIDGRMTQWSYNGESFLKLYDDIRTLQLGWELSLEKFKVDTIILPPNEPLIAAIRLKPESWRIVYEDLVSVIAERTEAKS